MVHWSVWSNHYLILYSTFSPPGLSSWRKLERSSSVFMKIAIALGTQNKRMNTVYFYCTFLSRIGQNNGCRSVFPKLWLKTFSNNQERTHKMDWINSSSICALEVKAAFTCWGYECYCSYPNVKFWFKNCFEAATAKRMLKLMKHLWEWTIEDAMYRVFHREDPTVLFKVNEMLLKNRTPIPLTPVESWRSGIWDELTVNDDIL